MPGVQTISRAQWKIVDPDPVDVSESPDSSIAKQHVVWNIGNISKVAQELSGEASGRQLDAEDIEGLNLIRMYRFMVCGQLQEVSIAHAEDVWQVLLDGKIVLRKSHSWKDNQGSLAFEVQRPNASKLPARIDMVWSNSKLVWSYTLTVNGIRVPAHWTKVKGDEQVIDEDIVVVAPEPSESDPPSSPCTAQFIPQQAQPKLLKGQAVDESLPGIDIDPRSTHVEKPDTDTDVDLELYFLDDEERLAKAMGKHEQNERQEKRRNRMKTSSQSRSRSITRTPSLASSLVSISEDDERDFKYDEEEDSPVVSNHDGIDIDKYVDVEVEVDENCFADVLDKVVTGLPFEAYQQGTEIQYYSATNKRWLPGTVHTTAFGKEYDVLVGPQMQHRSNVPLENIRMPFSMGQTVEYFAEQGQWVPAVVTKCSRHSVTTVTGYSIRVTKTGECFDRVSTERLRHHFPVGAEIWMYSTVASTWKKVKVSTIQEACEASLTERWTFVLVKPVNGDSSERVPSYLLRFDQPRKQRVYQKRAKNNQIWS